MLYRGMDRAALDAAYNNLTAVADSDQYLTDWRERSAKLRAAHPQHLDLRYGPADRQRLDYFACGRANAPTYVFIHGGYWLRNHKDGFAFVAEGPLAHGINVALIGYTLAPHTRLVEIVAQIREGVRFITQELPRLGGDPAKIYLSGWSAGGHLTAMAMSEPSVAGGLAISGIFDLEPIRLNYINDVLGLDEAEARQVSPIHHLPDRSKPLFITVGGAELPELQRQSAEYWKAWEEKRLPGRFTPVAGRNHFSILEELASPDGEIMKMVLELVGSGTEKR